MATNERKITLPVFGIVLNLYDLDGNTSGHITDNLTDPRDRGMYRAACDGLTSMILACACAGIDVESPAFLEAIETTVDAINRNHGD